MLLSLLRSQTLRVGMCLGSFMIASGQDAGKATQSDVSALAAQVQELRSALNEVREQLAGSRHESEELRRELQGMRQQLGLLDSSPATAPGPPVELAADKMVPPAEEHQVIDSKLRDLDQSKVESSSKYHVRLSGMALLNVFSNHGSVDNLDLPGYAEPKKPGDSGGAFGATVRQSFIGLEVFGPQWAGAKISGDLKFDFFGGFPASPAGVAVGLARLQTAKVTFDWKNTTLVAGQDALFFSPRTPTSLAATSYPALSGSGNIWSWTPQVYLEHRKTLSANSRLTLQGGILDGFTGELPSEYDREATAGERSRTPAYAARVAWQQTGSDRAATVGVGGYYSRQNWGFDRNVDGWAATADWLVPLGPWFSLSGEAYRGRSITGLGGGSAPSVLFKNFPATATVGAVLPLESAGGWSQLKFTPLARVEFNAAFGEDYPFRKHLNPSYVLDADTIVSRNISGFLNVIYQARSNLLFSVEYRRLWTTRFSGTEAKAGQINVGAGIVF